MIIRFQPSRFSFFVLTGALLCGVPSFAKPAFAKPARKPFKAAAKKPAKQPAKKTAPAFDSWMEDAEAKPIALKNDVVKAEASTEIAAKKGAVNSGIEAKPLVVINATTRNDKPSETTIQLAQNKTALMPIVVSAKASEAIKAAAADLALYLEKMSGAEFKVEQGDGNSGIVLGNISEFPHAELKAALQIRKGSDGREAFAIRTQPKRVLLIGATDIGASHAASRLLESLGYRHFFPHGAWEVVPNIPNLTFARDITDRPQMLARNIWFEAGSGGAVPEQNYRNWKRHNYQAESFKVSIGGGGMLLPKETMDAHPEYWAARKQPDGTLKREASSHQLELGNLEVRKLLVQASIDYLKKNPDADMVNMEPADTTLHSESPESLKLGTVSDAVFGMVNEIAREVEKAFPGQGKMVGVLSYNAYYDPPSFKMEPNVHVQMSPIGVNNIYPSEERYKVWSQRSSNLGVYEYYSVWLWSNDKLPGSYTNAVRGSQKHIRDELINRGVISMSAESTSSWGSNGRGYYVANKLMWNPNLDLNALLDDFYSKAFGPAAKNMRSYYDRLDPDNNPLMSASLLGQIFRDLDNASKAAQNRPDVLARLDQLKLYLRFVDLMWHRDNEGGKVEGEQIMSNLFRTREYALTSWSMISQNWGGGKGSDAPYTREEIEKDFQEGFARYQPKIRDDLQPRLKYSTDVVSVRWPGIKPEQNQIDSTQRYQGAMRYAMVSLKGEPLEFATEAGDAWGVAYSIYTLKDAKGKVLQTGKPVMKVPMTYKIAVPGPGVYFLDYDDRGAYWTFSAKANLPYSIVALPEIATARGVSNLPEVYFYVPKGTSKIEYFATSPHSVNGPDGVEQKAVPVANDWITIPVPAGMDGKPWTMRNVTFGKFHFSNIPSYFSPTPDGLLVPRDVAEKDGLNIRN